MHRYIFHHIFLADGTKLVVGVVCQPHTCSKWVQLRHVPSTVETTKLLFFFQNWILKRVEKKERCYLIFFFLIYSLECGFISTRSGVLVPIDHCNLKLANHGESGTPPMSYSFLVGAGKLNSKEMLHTRLNCAIS